MTDKEKEKIVYGDYYNDTYLLIKETWDGYPIHMRQEPQYLIVDTDYFQYESAIIFTVGNPLTDWSEKMLLDMAKKVVDVLNKKEIHPDCSD